MSQMTKWNPLSPDQRDTERIASKSTTYLQNVIYQFSRRKSAVAGVVVVAIMVLAALIGPFMTGKTYDYQKLSHVNMAPVFSYYELGEKNVYITSNLKLLEISPEGIPLDYIDRLEDDALKKRIEYNIGGETFYLSYKNSMQGLLDAEGNPVTSTKTVYNKFYPLGSDGLGRDILTRLLYGTRVSLAVAFIATVVNLLIGVLYGSVSGYAGGTCDMAMMRIVDIISSIPLTLYVILIMVMFNNGGLTSIIIALGLVYWVSMARVVRSQILGLKEQDFVLAAKTMNSSSWYVLRNHLIVNSIGPITVTATMQIPSAIFTEAFMSFIGLGVTAPMASLGTMCNDALDTLKIAPYQLIFPALAICIIMFAFSFIGDGLRDAFDPHMRK